MHLANLTTAGIKRISGLIFFLFIFSFVSAQENSPYSRYGIGDIVPNQNVVNRGMGGIAAGYTDFQSINFINPASIASATLTILDLGGEIDIRTLKSTSTPDKYRATNTLISYLQIGFPIASAKMKKKDNSWGFSFGLRPVSRISYKIEKNERLTGIDSLNTLYEGSGGLNQVNVGTGIRIKTSGNNLRKQFISVGLNTGYSFGNKDYSTKIDLINDSIIYYKSNTQSQSRFSGFFLNLGAQYEISLPKNAKLIIGAYGNLRQNLKARSDNIEETFTYDGSGGTINIDTINFGKDIEGTVKLPGTYAAGFTYANSNWLFGADFETTNWNKYRYYGQKDVVQNSWVMRVGAQYYPAKENTVASKYWSFVKYRAGFYYGPDYIKLDKSRLAYAATLGASFPLTSLQRIRYGEYVVLNTGFEFGARGNKQTLSVRENITRISIGVSMNARWFQKRSYD